MSKEKRLAFWGPQLNNMQFILQNHSLNEVCALQWQRCVDNAEEALSQMPVNKVLRVRYEDFVHQPEFELRKILDFIGMKIPQINIMKAVEGVSPNNLGKGRKSLGYSEVAKLEALVSETLKRYDYL